MSSLPSADGRNAAWAGPRKPALPIAPANLAGLGAEAEEWRRVGIGRAFEFGEDRADAGPAAGRFVFLRAPGHALVGVVRAGGPYDGADDGELVHHLGHAREQFANLGAGDVGGDGLELASNLARCIHLQVPHVLMRRAAGKEQVDNRLVRGADAGLGLGLQQVGHGQPADAHGTDADEVASGNAVTKVGPAVFTACADL